MVSTVPMEVAVPGDPVPAVEGVTLLRPLPARRPVTGVPGTRLDAALDVLTTAAVGGGAWLTGALGPGTALGLGVLWLGLLGGSHAYAVGRGSDVRVVLRAAAPLVVVAWTVVALTGLADRPAPLLAAGTLLVGGALAHRTATRALVTRRDARHDPVRTLVAGGATDAPLLGAALLSDPRPYELVGTLTVTDRADVQRVVRTAVEQSATAVVASPGPAFGPAAMQTLAWQLRAAGAELHLGTGHLEDRLVLHPLPRRPRHRVVRVVKSLAERVLAAVLLLLMAPALATIALAVRWDSTGPALFRQARVGRFGETFTMYKFRTMTRDAEARVHELTTENEVDGPLFKIRHDPRLTRLGAVLRRYSLDELPQLLNVVRGQMSLVGPRPSLPAEVLQFDATATRRLQVKPGLTGLWQISGRSDLSWDDAVRLDLLYVDTWSLRLDAAILARTARAVLGHRGAY